MAKTKLFSVTEKDLEWTYFRATGPGGQKVNKTSSACRVTHTPSGVTAESREERQQIQNRRIALQRLADNPKFKLWCQMHIAANKEGFESVAAKVEAAMDERNLLIETAPECTPGETVCDVKK